MTTRAEFMTNHLEARQEGEGVVVIRGRVHVAFFGHVAFQAVDPDDHQAHDVLLDPQRQGPGHRRCGQGPEPCLVVRGDDSTGAGVSCLCWAILGQWGTCWQRCRRWSIPVATHRKKSHEGGFVKGKSRRQRVGCQGGGGPSKDPHQSLAAESWAAGEHENNEGGERGDVTAWRNAAGPGKRKRAFPRGLDDAPRLRGLGDSVCDLRPLYGPLLRVLPPPYHVELMLILPELPEVVWREHRHLQAGRQHPSGCWFLDPRARLAWVLETSGR